MFRFLLLLLGLLPLRLCRLLGGVVVIGTFLLTNRTVHRGRCVSLLGGKTFVQLSKFKEEYEKIYSDVVEYTTPIIKALNG